MEFRAQRKTPMTQCPVVGCKWVSTIAAWEDGGLTLVDDHMVDVHPRTEWARRVLGRRAERRDEQHHGG